jgi:hypothetical protein
MANKNVLTKVKKYKYRMWDSGKFKRWEKQYKKERLINAKRRFLYRRLHDV